MSILRFGIPAKLSLGFNPRIENRITETNNSDLVEIFYEIGQLLCISVKNYLII
jgi:hypothetical protein